MISDADKVKSRFARKKSPSRKRALRCKLKSVVVRVLYTTHINQGSIKPVRVAERVAEGQEYSRGFRFFGNGYVLRCNQVHSNIYDFEAQ